MHIQIISSIIGWFVTTLGIATKATTAAAGAAMSAAATHLAKDGLVHEVIHHLKP